MEKAEREEYQFYQYRGKDSFRQWIKVANYCSKRPTLGMNPS